MIGAIAGQSWADDAHPFNVEINGVDWVNRVEFSSIRVEMPGPGSNGSLTFTLRDKDATNTVSEWDEVRLIEHAATRPVLFGGFVQSVRIASWTRTGRDVVVTCVGYGILLDKKVVVTHELHGNFVAAGRVADAMADVVGKYGGRVTAVTQIGTTLQTDDDHGVAQLGNFWNVIGPSGPYTQPSITTPTTLRGALDAIGQLANTNDAGGGPGGEDLMTPTPFAFWVDSACMLRALPDPASIDTTVWPSHADQRFDDTVPGFAVDMAGTYRVAGMEYEREDTDRVTSAYVNADFIVRQGGDESADVNRFVVSTNMIRGKYDLQNSGRPSWTGGFVVTITHTAAGTVDTLGTIVVRGRDMFGKFQKEVIRPENGATVTGGQVWSRIISVKGHGWVAVAGTDNIEVGHASDAFYLDTSGTGYYRLPPLERAGDLEVLVSNPDFADVAADVAQVGGPAVAQTTAATVRGSVSLYATTPLAIWPGRQVTITSPPTSQTSAEEWRATSVVISFKSTAARTYTIGYGGNVPLPSQARRSGRFARR